MTRARFKRTTLLCQALCALSFGLAAWPTLADDECHVPVREWQSREAVRRMAAEQGWQVRRLKIDDGCYEIGGTDADGHAFKAKLDPRTLAIVKIKHKDREGEHRRRPASAHPGASRAAESVAPASAPPR